MIWWLIGTATAFFVLGFALGMTGRLAVEEEDREELIREGMDRVIAAQSLVLTEHKDEFNSQNFFAYMEEVSKDPVKRLMLLSLIQESKRTREEGKT